MKFDVIDCIMFVILALGAIHGLGFLSGMAVVAGVFLLAPYYKLATITTGRLNTVNSGSVKVEQ